jgi:hypothetical protein
MILDAGDAGADAARIQLANARISSECGHCPSVQFQLDGPAPPKVEADGNPVTGAFRALHGTDGDGMLVEIALIVMDGYVTALEVWRGDGKELLPPPPLHGFELFGAASWDEAQQPEWFVTGGWAHRVEGGVDGVGWTVSVDGNPHRIDIEAPSPLASSPRITLDGERLKPKLRLAYNKISAAPFRVGEADAQLRLQIWAPPYIERLRRTFLGALRRIPIFFRKPQLDDSQADGGVECRYTVIIDGTEMGTIIWFPGKGFAYAPPGLVL